MQDGNEVFIAVLIIVTCPCAERQRGSSGLWSWAAGGKGLRVPRVGGMGLCH